MLLMRRSELLEIYSHCNKEVGKCMISERK